MIYFSLQFIKTNFCFRQIINTFFNNNIIFDFLLNITLFLFNIILYNKNNNYLLNN